MSKAFNVFNMLKDKDKTPSKMQPKQGFIAHPHMPKPAQKVTKMKNLKKVDQKGK